MRPFVHQYDRIYSDKDYDKDISDFITLIGNPALNRLRVLEIGGGTGNQSFRLAAMVNSLTALEIDGDFADMFEDKLARSDLQNIHLERNPLELLEENSFDTSAAFFHVLNYIDRDSLPDFCKDLSRRLKHGAHFVADLWHAEAVVIDPPKPRTEAKRVGEDFFWIEIVPDMNREELTVSLQYKIRYRFCDQGGSYIERLNLFLWTRGQLLECFENAGFVDISFWDYRHFPGRATDDSWRVWLRATKA